MLGLSDQTDRGRAPQLALVTARATPLMPFMLAMRLRKAASLPLENIELNRGANSHIYFDQRSGLWMRFPIAANEPERLRALRSLGVFRSDTDPALKKVVALAGRIFPGTSAVVTLVEENCVCLKKATEATITIIDRASATCNWTILSDDVFVVNDALNDPRFADLPHLKRQPDHRFYAGAPLILASGIRVGALCVTDTIPRHLAADEARQLKDLAEVAVSLLRLQQARIAEEVANHSLRESEARFRHLAENAPVMVWVTEPNGECSYLSHSWYAFTGQPFGEGLGLGWLDRVHPDERDVVSTSFQDANEKQRSFRCEMRIRCHDGSYHWMIDAAVPRFDEQTGQFLGYVGSVTDITEQKETEGALLATQRRLRMALTTTQLGIWNVDLTTMQRNWSPEMKAMLGFPQSVQPSRELFLERLHPDDRDLVEAEPQVALPNGGLCDRAVMRITRADNGEERLLEITGQRLFDDTRHSVSVVGTMQDITERRRAEDAIRTSEERLRLALQSARMYAWERSFANDYVERSEGSLDVIGMGSGPVGDFVQRIHADDKFSAAEVCSTGWGVNGTPSEFRFIKPNGDIIWLSGRSTIHQEAGRPDRVIGVAYDITQRKAAEEDLWRTANQDPLTGLPNRALFQSRLAQALLEAADAETQVTLFLIDLDNFKDVNDTLGHDAGDGLLKEIARRLLSLIRPEDTVARLGGDEFAVVTSSTCSENHVARLKASIISSLGESFVFGDRVVACSASVGVANFPEHHRELSELLKDADIALYRAKHDGRNQMVSYEPAMRAETELRVNIGSQIRKALIGSEIIPYYQPKICLASGRIIGFEALARWQNPSKGLLTPAYFGTAFDNAELASAIGHRMLANVVADMGAWQDASLDFGQVAINLSPTEFADAKLADRLFDALRTARLSPSTLEVEVTETAFIGRRVEAITAILQELHSGGITVALDDFGTGSASLTHLKQFPVDHIKIDRSFIMGLEHVGDDAAIVSAIIRLGKDLGLSVTAEGVESDGQVQRLAEEGCDFAQGHIFAKPMPASRVPWFLRTWMTEGHQVRGVGRMQAY